MQIAVGETFGRSVSFDAATISAFAAAAGDLNPIHHDTDVAEASRFKGLVASGAHTTALMIGVVGAEISRRGPAVGLKFTCALRRAVPAGCTMRIVWEVTGLRPSARGTLVALKGRMVDSDSGAVAVTAFGTCLSLQKVPAVPPSETG